MCVAILKPKGVAISEEVLKNCWDNNPDGAGFAYVKRRKVVTLKGFMSFEKFIEEYRKAEPSNRDSSPFVIHFRIATAGRVCPENTHPFPVEGGVLVHNGHMFYTDRTGEKSDTRLFCEDTMDYLKGKREWVANKKAIEDAIGYNKLALLFNDGDYLIINENSGMWKDGVWYSNRHSHTPAGRGGWGKYWGGAGINDY